MTIPPSAPPVLAEEPAETLDELLDDLAYSYLKKGEGFMVPGAARMRLEAFVTRLISERDALLAQARQGREDAERLEEPDTFWLRDDPEVCVTDIGEFTDTVEQGEVARVLCGRSLPDRWIAHIPIPETADRDADSEIRLFKTHAEALAAIAATPSPSPEGAK